MLLWAGKKISDAIFVRLAGEKVIDRAWNTIKKKIKAQYTRFKTIKADFNFTAYTRTEISIKDAKEAIERVPSHCERFSKDNTKFGSVNWTDDHTAKVTVEYLDNEPFEVTLDLIQNNASLLDAEVNTVSDAKLESIGISVRFEFAFHELKGVLMDLNNFADFLRRGLVQEFDIRNYTNSQLAIGSLDNDLTLDDWMEEQRFEASLLLKGEQEERSVEFYGDKAIVTSPYEQVDDTTADYIRATLLNYYL
ncbi:hypothetical protein ZOD2009_19018 [Haladaptatus paucihalophilus DX253]|uniref:Uncharacterized protein n=1 Tax=Haladaptatus paucihalophilus DX253 TaxID=797209 RepID=E7QYB3_HALPU|nr:hypothetical protein ZOD2009_19018 [Haladaptatus paucihalophilus DX253]